MFAFLFWAMGFPSEPFNKTLEENRDRIRPWFSRHSDARPVVPGGWASFALYTILAAALLSLVEQEATLDAAKTLTLALGFLVAVPVTTIAYAWPAEAGAHTVAPDRAQLRFMPAALVFAAACVALARWADFQPGYVYGLFAFYAPAAAFIWSVSMGAASSWIGQPAGGQHRRVAAVATRRGRRRRARRAIRHARLDAALAAIFCLGVQTLVFGLIPITFMDGMKLRTWSSWAWARVWGCALLLLVHVMFAKFLGEVDSLADAIKASVPFLVFFALSAGCWLVFKARHIPRPSRVATAVLVLLVATPATVAIALTLRDKPVPPPPITATVNETANVRAGPSRDTKRVGTLSTGTLVTLDCVAEAGHGPFHGSVTPTPATSSRTASSPSPTPAVHHPASTATADCRVPSGASGIRAKVPVPPHAVRACVDPRPMLDAPVTPARGPAPSAVRRLGHPLVLLGPIYLAASVALHHRVFAAPASTAIGSGTTDHNLFLWWLNWTPWSILHGQNPMFTDFQHYPFGVNAMWNTSVPLLGVLLAPVTLAAGPVAAFNVGVVLGPAVSGVAMAAALGAYVRAWVPRAVAGALYAFAPFHLAHASVAHLNLVWSLLPPALLYLAHVLFVRRLTRPVLVGAAGGAAFAAQTLRYPQTVATGVLMLVVTAAVLAVGWPRRVLRRCRGWSARACRAWALCVLCAYPLYLLLAGPVRPRARIRDPEIDRADAANLVVPTRLTAVRPVPDGLAERMHGQVGEQGGYVGVAMLVLLVVALVTVRSATVRVAAVVGVVAFALSLGPSLVVLGTDTEMPLPWRAVMAVPLVGEAEPVRMQVYVALCVAVIVAVWLDRLPGLRGRPVPRPSPSPPPRWCRGCRPTRSRPRRRPCPRSS